MNQNVGEVVGVFRRRYGYFTQVISKYEETMDQTLTCLFCFARFIIVALNRVIKCNTFELKKKFKKNVRGMFNIIVCRLKEQRVKHDESKWPCKLREYS